MFPTLSLLRIYNIQLAYRGLQGFYINNEAAGRAAAPTSSHLLGASQDEPNSSRGPSQFISTRLRDHESSFRDEENQAFQF